MINEVLIPFYYRTRNNIKKILELLLITTSLSILSFLFLKKIFQLKILFIRHIKYRYNPNL
ncbi:MAG: hypothetical protein L6V81_01045 [Clostridium sp.]|nr:MAG: hypothetical protein L6V81_01045 [Clostridium sp.]